MEELQAVPFEIPEEEATGVPFSFTTGLPKPVADLKGAHISAALDDGTSTPEIVSDALQYDSDDSAFRDALASKQAQEIEGYRDEYVEQFLTTPSFDAQTAAAGIMDLSGVDVMKTVDEYGMNVEKEYAGKLAAFTLATATTPLQDEPNAIDFVLYDNLVDEMAFQTVLKEQIAEIAAADTGNPVNDTYEFLSNWFPFVSDARHMNEVSGFRAESRFWAGSNFTEQINYVRGLPLRDRIPAARNVITKLLDEGLPDQADIFAKALLQGRSENDSLYDNIMITGLSVFDIATLGTTSKIVRGVGRGVKGAFSSGEVIGSRAEAVMAGIARGNAIPNGRTGVNIAEEVADHSSATAAKLMEEVAPDLPKGANVVMDEAWGAVNAGRHLNGQTTQSAANLMKIKAFLADPFSAVARILSTPNIDRMAFEELQTAVQHDSTLMLERFKTNSANIIDIEGGFSNKVKYGYNDKTNTSTLAIHLGMKNGELFNSKEAAEDFAKRTISKKTSDYTFESRAGKWYVEVIQDLDESKSLRENLRPIESNKFNEGFVNQTLRLGWLRTPSDVLPTSNMADRGTALHGGQHIFSVFKDITRPISNLTRKADREELVAMLNMQRNGYHPVTKRRGFYFETVDDFSNAYFMQYNKMPKPELVAANFAYRQAMDTEFFLRNLGRYRDVVRVGGKEIEVGFTIGKGGKKQKMTGLGKQVDDINFADGDFRIALVDKGGKTQFKYSKGVNSLSQDDFAKLKADGYQIYKTIDDGFKFGDKGRAHYVMTKSDVKLDRPSMKNVAYNEGGHVVEKYPFYIKQPKTMGENIKFYLGDNVFANAYTFKQAQSIAAVVDRARKSLAQGTDEWKRIVDEEMDWMNRDSFQKMFDEDGYDVNQPFIATKAGGRARDFMDPRDTATWAEEKANNINEMAFLDKNFTQARDDVRPFVLREEEAGRHVIDEAEMIDPLEALNLGVRSAVNNSLQKDYIAKSMQQLLGNFGDIIQIDPKTAFSDPLRFLHGGPEIYKAGADGGRKSIAEAARKAILNQIGERSTESYFLDAVATQIGNLMLPGSNGFKKVEKYLLPLVKDPFVFARNIVFDLKLGLFNPLQIPVQAQTLTHLLALSPKHAHAGTTAAWAMQGMRLTGEGNWKSVAAHFGKAIGKVHDGKGGFGRMSSEQFQESFQMLKESGFDLVGSDLAHLDDATNYNLFSSKGKKFLDAGRGFFNGVERMLRISGWNTAYLEMRSKVGTRAFTNAERNEILRRADELTVNMSSMNNASFQKGLFGVPFQFAAYQIRLMEQLFPSLVGKGRIPRGKAWQALGVYSAMYGVGYGGLSAAVGGVFPAGDALRQYAVENNLEVDDSFYEAVFDGIPSVLAEMLTGYDLDWSGRYAPGGFNLVKDIWDGEASLMEISLGASGSVLGNVSKSASNSLVTAFQAMTDVETNDGTYAVLASDLLDVVREASSVNAAYGAYQAFNAGKWYSRRGREVGEVDPWEALLAKGLGATPTRFNINYVRGTVMKQEREARTAASRNAKDYYAKSLTAMKNGNWQEHYAYVRRAKAELIAAGFTQLEAHKSMRNAMSQEPFEQEAMDQWEKHIQRKEQAGR